MQTMLPIIMNTSFQKLAVIDDYTSFIWASRYYATGDFEICTEASVDMMSLIKKDYYVVREDDDNVGIIEDIKIQHNADNHDVMIISGRFLDAIIGRRIIANQTTVNGKISACINTLLTKAGFFPIFFL